MWAGVAPIPVWSAKQERFRLTLGGNRQTTVALHRIAITQPRMHPDGQTRSIRLLKRKLANVVYRTP